MLSRTISSSILRHRPALRARREHQPTGMPPRRTGGHKTARPTLAILVAGSAIAGGVTTPAAASPPAYLFSQVSVPHEVSTQVTGINDSGTFTGFACDNRCRHPIFFVGRGNTIRYFSIPFSNFSPTSPAGPSGIDDAGEIVGFYSDDRGIEHGFVRAPTGAMTTLNVPNAAQTRGGGTSIDGISPGGIIVGGYFDSHDVEQGFIDQQGRVATYVEPNAGTARGAGTQVNFYLNGEFGGQYFSADGAEHGFYTSGSTVHSVDSPLLPTPTSDHGTELTAAGSDGTLYGTVSPPGEAASEGFADHQGVFTTIVDPNQIGTSEDFGTVVANASGSGIVVGNYSYTLSGDRMGMVARPNG